MKRCPACKVDVDDRLIIPESGLCAACTSCGSPPSDSDDPVWTCEECGLELPYAKLGDDGEWAEPTEMEKFHNERCGQPWKCTWLATGLDEERTIVSDSLQKMVNGPPYAIAHVWGPQNCWMAAAAPDMYRAIERLLDANYSGDLDTRADAVRDAKAALKKARGGA